MLRGVVHTFSNPGTVPARVIVISSPGGVIRYFEEAAALSNASPTGQPDTERLAAPANGPVWDINVIKRLVLNDLYKPHTYQEMADLLGPEALARLEPGGLYGVQWHNRRKTATRTVSEPDGNGGRIYRRRRTTKSARARSGSPSPYLPLSLRPSPRPPGGSWARAGRRRGST